VRTLLTAFKYPQGKYMKKLFLISASILSLTACVSTELSNQNQPYDASKDARIRLYGQNGRPSYLTVNIDGKKEKVTIGGGLGQAFSSMVGAKSNESIGMPATELSKDPSAHSKFLSGIFFKEFVIPANSKVTVQNEIIPLDHSHTHYTTTEKITTIIKGKICKGNMISFIPEAGKNYEVAPISSDRECGVSLYEIK
jgi:raw score 5.41